jgi:phosphotransferase system enzyme I (PtsI)
VLATRKQISLWTKKDACALADKVMAMKTATEVYEALREAAR